MESGSARWGVAEEKKTVSKFWSTKWRQCDCDTAAVGNFAQWKVEPFYTVAVVSVSVKIAP